MQKLPIALGTMCTNENLLVLAQDYSRVVQKIEDAVVSLNHQKSMIQRHVKELYPTRRMNQVFAYTVKSKRKIAGVTVIQIRCYFRLFVGRKNPKSMIREWRHIPMNKKKKKYLKGSLFRTIQLTDAEFQHRNLLVDSINEFNEISNSYIAMMQAMADVIAIAESEK